MIRVQEADFDAGVEIDRMIGHRTDIGGVATFMGLVRDANEGEAVSGMTLEHYPGMTEKALTRIEAQARERWPLQDVLIIHRFGPLKPGERIVLVVTASAHRQAALESCEFLIDWLKVKAPFWKLEDRQSGATWVEARDSDSQSAERHG